MRIVIAGGHGKIALLLERFLAERGDQADSGKNCQKCEHVQDGGGKIHCAGG